MINPTVILQQRMQKATELVITAMRCAIHTKRVSKFNKIDLRTLRSYPEKKKRIRAIIIQNQFRAGLLLRNMLLIQSQPIQKKSFAKGGEIAHIKYKNHDSKQLDKKEHAKSSISL